MKLRRIHAEIYIDLLDGWVGELTWDLLVKKAADLHTISFTRQTLSANSRIQSAFRHTKQRIASNRINSSSDTVRLSNMSERNIVNLYESFNRLKTENERLTKENEAYMNKFLIWSYNASNRGMTEADLEKPMPSVNRFITKLK